MRIKRFFAERISLMDLFILVVGLVFMVSSVLTPIVLSNIANRQVEQTADTKQTLKELRAAVAYPATPQGQAATSKLLALVADGIVNRLAKQPTRVIVVPGKTRTIIIERTRTVCVRPNGRPC